MGIKLKNSTSGGGFSKETKKTKMVNFGNFSQESVKREEQVSSILLPLKDIEPFEHNVRIDYEEEAMDRLKQSIKNNGNIGNIDVFHIVKGDRYIISDGHRTYKAYTELYGPSHKVEVIVRQEFPDYNQEVEINLMKIGFITSNTKENLGVHEELEAILKYLEKLDNLFPEKAPHTISQSKIYKSLGLSESKAMKLNKIIKTTPQKLFGKFKKLNVSYKTLVELSSIQDKDKYDEIVEMVKSGDVDNSEDLKTYKKIIEENNLEKGGDDLEKKEKIKEEFRGYKKEKKEKKSMTLEEKLIKDIIFSVNKLHKALLNLNPDKLTDKQFKVIKNFLRSIQDVIKKKNLK